jgi:hypothetical protein
MSLFWGKLAWRKEEIRKTKRLGREMERKRDGKMKIKNKVLIWENRVQKGKGGRYQIDRAVRIGGKFNRSDFAIVFNE